MLELELSRNDEGGLSNNPISDQSNGQSGHKVGADQQHEVPMEGNVEENASVDYWEEVTTEDAHTQYYNHTTGEYHTSLPAAKESHRKPLVEEALPTGGTPQENSVTGASPFPIGSMGELPEPVVDYEGYEHGSTSQTQETPLPDEGSTTARDEIRRAIRILYPKKFMEATLKAAVKRAIHQLRCIAYVKAEQRRRSLLAIRADFRQSKKISFVPGQELPHFPRVKFRGERKLDEAKNEEDGPCPDSDGQAEEESKDLCRGSPCAARGREIISGDKLAEVLDVLFSKTKEEARLTMRTIELSSQGIGPQGAQALAPALSSCVIVAIYLGNNHIGNRGIASLAEGLKHARGLQKLHLNDNEITDDGCHQLMNALNPLKVLYTLDLSHNPFGVEGCRSIANFLCQPGCPLQSLSIAGMSLGIHPKAWKTIGEREVGGKPWVPPRPGDDGAVAIASALLSPYGCPLRHLRLANAGMRTIGIKAIAAALCANVTLETLDLSGNDFMYNKADENVRESAAELLSFGLKVNTRVRAVTLRACGLARKQVLAILGNISPQDCFPGQADDDDRIARGDAHGAGRLHTTIHQKGTKPLLWWEEKRLGFRAALLRDWLLDAARLQGIRYPKPPSLDPADELCLFKRHSRGQNRMVDVIETAESGRFSTRTRPSLNHNTLAWSEPSALKQEASLVGPTLWSGLSVLQQLINRHETVTLENEFSGNSSPRKREARVLSINETALPCDADPSCHELHVQLDRYDASAEENLTSDELGLYPTRGRSVIVEEKVVDDLQSSHIRGSDDFTAGDGVPCTVGVGEETGQVGEKIEHPRTSDDRARLLDTKRVGYKKSFYHGHRTNKTENSGMIHEHDEASKSLTISLASSSDELRSNNSTRAPLSRCINACRAEDSDNAICPDGGDSQRLSEAEGGGGYSKVDKMDKVDSASDRHNISAGQSEVFILISHGNCKENTAPSGDRCLDREREGRANTVDAPARAEKVLAKEDVRIREARPELSMETTWGCGVEHGVKVTALERGLEVGHKLETIVEDRLRELEESEMALLSERRKLRESQRASLQTTVTEDNMLKAQLVRARSKGDLAIIEDRVRRLGIRVDSAKGLAAASQAELMAARKRSLRTQSEAEVIPSKDSFVGIQELEHLWRERVEHADELEEELQDARRCLQARFEGIEKTIAEGEAELSSLRERSNEDSSTFREKLNGISTSLDNLSVEESALRRFSKVLSGTIARLEAMASSVRDEEALRALVPYGSGRRDLDLQVAAAAREISKVTADIEAARNRQDHAIAELEKARLALAIFSAQRRYVASAHKYIWPGGEKNINDWRLKNATSSQQYSRASTCPVRVVPNDTPPLEDTQKGDLPRAAKIDQETAPSGDISGREKTRETRVCGEQGDMLDVGGGGRARGEHGDNDRVIPCELSRAALVSAIDAVTHPGLDDVAAVDITPPTAEDIRKLEEALFCAERDHRNALALKEAPNVKQALSLMRDHAVILHLASKEDNRDTPEGEQATIHACSEESDPTQMIGRRRVCPGEETPPLIAVGLNSRVELGAKVSNYQGGVEEDEQGNPVLPQVDERGLTVEQRMLRLRDVRENAQREKRRAHAEYSRKLKRNLRARKRLILAERQADRIARAMDAKQLTEALREGGCHNTDATKVEELRCIFVENIRSKIRVRLHPTSRWTRSREKSRRMQHEAVGIGEIVTRRQLATSRRPSPQSLALNTFPRRSNALFRHANTV